MTEGEFAYFDVLINEIRTPACVEAFEQLLHTCENFAAPAQEPANADDATEGEFGCFDAVLNEILTPACIEAFEQLLHTYENFAAPAEPANADDTAHAPG